MMQVELSHVLIQGVNCAVFDADSRDHSSSGRQSLLYSLTESAIESGLRVEKAALAYKAGGRLEFFGTPDLVKYLTNRGYPGTTHTITV